MSLYLSSRCLNLEPRVIRLHEAISFRRDLGASFLGRHQPRSQDEHTSAQVDTLPNACFSLAILGDPLMSVAELDIIAFIFSRNRNTLFRIGPFSFRNDQTVADAGALSRLLP